MAGIGRSGHEPRGDRGGAAGAQVKGLPNGHPHAQGPLDRLLPLRVADWTVRPPFGALAGQVAPRCRPYRRNGYTHRLVNQARISPQTPRPGSSDFPIDIGHASRVAFSAAVSGQIVKDHV